MKNNAEPLILEDDDKPVFLGEEAVHGFLFAIFVKEKALRFICHHGIADGRGCLMFLKALLYFYYVQIGEKIDDEGLVQTDESPVVAYGEKHVDNSVKPFGAFEPKPEDDFFTIPETPFPTDSNLGRNFEISCPIAPILAYAKRADTTPVPFLDVLIVKALENTYAVGEQTVLGMSAVDYRVIFKDQAANNAAGAVYLPFFHPMAKWDQEMQMTALRARIDLSIQPRNLTVSINSFVSRAEGFKAIPLPVQAVPKIISSKIHSAKKNVSFSISYVGGVRFPADLQKHIDNLAVYYPPFFMPLYFMAVENNGILNITCTQNFESETFGEELFKLIKKEIPAAKFTKGQVKQFDGFRIAKAQVI